METPNFVVEFVEKLKQSSLESQNSSLLYIRDELEKSRDVRLEELSREMTNIRNAKEALLNSLKR